MKHDLFISYVSQDGDEVRTAICKPLDRCKITHFTADKLEPGRDWASQLAKAIDDSRHFLLYWSKNASLTEHPWIDNELAKFISHHTNDKSNRFMFVLFGPDVDQNTLPSIAKDLQHPSSLCEIVGYIKNHRVETLSGTVQSLGQELDESKATFENEKEKVKRAREYYKHDRFWQPFRKNREVHIFTCARDVRQDVHRGRGGRTNIDMWDYRSVLDITHFFLSKYPEVKVKIEDPISKMSAETILSGAYGFDLATQLIGRDCIIIGSPDVSDLAEIVLAKMHKIPGYSLDRVKTKGYVIIKEKEHSRSSVYWELRKDEKDEEEGVARIIERAKRKYYPHVHASPNGPGRMHGILATGFNPFGAQGATRGNNRIMILSGFSGPATNAICKILTDDDFLAEFFKLDEAYVDLDRSIEALIGVNYTEDEAEGWQKRDTRRIAESGGITFEGLVEIG